MKQLFLNDTQIPHHDRRAVATCMTFARQWKPDEIHILGDLLDLTGASRFPPQAPRKKPAAGRFAEGTNVQFGIDQADDFLGRLRDGFPRATILLYEGNHEERLAKFLLKDPALYQFRGTDLDTQLHLTERHIELVPRGELKKLGNLYATHGNFIRKHSGASAKAHFEAHGVSVIHGHTHRGGVFYQTVLGRTVQCYENFCLCRLDQDYLTTKPNWQQGWSICHNFGRRGFHLVPIPYEHGCAHFLDQTFHANGPGWAFVDRLGKARRRAA